MNSSSCVRWARSTLPLSWGERGRRLRVDLDDIPTGEDVAGRDVLEPSPGSGRTSRVSTCTTSPGAGTPDSFGLRVA